MASLSTKSICLMAKARMSPSPDASSELLLALIRSALPAAINTFAENVARGTKRRLLQKQFNFTITSMSSDMSAAFSAAEPLLLPYDPMTGMYFPFQACRIGLSDMYFVSDRQTLKIIQTDDGYVYYTIENQVLYLAAQTAAADATVVNVIGNYVPAIIDEVITIPTEFQDDLVDELIKTFLREQQMKAA